jgi:hypothetical protein
VRGTAMLRCSRRRRCMPGSSAQMDVP